MDRILRKLSIWWKTILYILYILFEITLRLRVSAVHFFFFFLSAAVREPTRTFSSDINSETSANSR